MYITKALFEIRCQYKTWTTLDHTSSPPNTPHMDPFRTWTWANGFRVTHPNGEYCHNLVSNTAKETDFWSF